MTPLQEALAAAYQAAAEATTEPEPTFSPTAPGYYARPEVPAEEVTEALAEAGIHLNLHTR